MTKQEYNNEIQALWRTNYNFHKECRMSIDIKEKYIASLEATIEAQEIIIRDNTAFMEEMAQPKSCSNCKHSKNVRVHTDITEWFCDITPFNHIDLEGEYDEVFKTFNCSLWVNVFEKAQQ